MSGVLRLANTGGSNGRSTIVAAASTDATFTLPPTGGTILTTDFDTVGDITWNGSNINITNADLNVNSGQLFVDESTGFVGIGTTSPLSQLSIQNGTNPALGFYTGTSLRAELEATVSQTTLTSYSNSPLVFKTGGSGEIEALNIDRFGNVGIKTSENTSLYAGGNDLVVGDGGSSNQGLTIYTGTSNQGIVAFADGFTGAAEQYAGYLLYEHSEDRMTFATSGIERLRINSEGNIRIDTTATGSAKLRFDNAQDATPSDVNKIHLFNNGGTIAGFGISSGQLNYKAPSHVFYLSNNSEAARLDSSGRLLVGTSSTFGTDSHFQIVGNYGNIAEFFRIGGGDFTSFRIGSTRGTVASPDALTASDSIAQIAFRSYTGSAYADGASIKAQLDGINPNNDLPTRLVFSTTADGSSSPTERMRITSNGLMQMGDPATNGGWQVFVSDPGTASQRGRMSFRGKAGQFGGSEMLQGYLGTTEQIRITINGNITNINNSYGPLSSDERLKQDIVDAGSQWDDIKATRIAKFRYKNDPTGDLQLGPIAQELEQVSPGLVTRRPVSEEEVADPSNALVDGDEVLSFKASIFYMKAVKALQEAMERIEQLETEVSKLRSK